MMSTATQQIDLVEERVESKVKVSYEEKAIVIVGAGPVGIHFASELVKRHCELPVVIYGSEPWKPYDRVRLSSYLAGDVGRDDLDLDTSIQSANDKELRLNCEIRHIDREAKTVTDVTGNVQHYSHLVLAVGSTPFVPHIGNSHYDGVFTFRSLGEADELFARRMRSHHTVVIGGGLLGLETARAMQKYNTEITVIEHNPWLMMQQLDETGGEVLKEFVESKNVNVVTGDSVVSITGNNRVEGVSLRSGKEVACDTVIVAAGIRPNVNLAMVSGLSCLKGIRVNDYLETSARDIYAIGECAEHNNSVYGLVKPGLEQAAVLADRITGGNSRYVGSMESTRLKVMEQSVFSVGRTGVDESAPGAIREFTYTSKEDGSYRKIRVSGNRLIGAIAVGDWHELSLLQDAIQSEKRLMFWHLMRFEYSGNIWGNEEDLDIAAWPSGAVVCNCTGVTRGRLTQALESGCENVACLTTKTRAASVCGACKPLLAELVGEDAQVEPVKAWRGLLAISALTMCLVALFIFIWRVPYPDTVQVSVRWDELWRSSLLKQVSGFTMLGLIVIGLGVTLRKRIKIIEFGEFNSWRYMHVVLGVGALVALVTHTGFRLGDELNFLLMLNFLLLTAVGANASTVIATEHRSSPLLAKKQRKRWTWLHLLVFWPLPILLGFHVAKTYYF